MGTVEQRDVDVRAFAGGRVGFVERCGDACNGELPCNEVGKARPSPHNTSARHPAGQAGHAHQPTHPPEHGVVARENYIRAGLTKSPARAQLTNRRFNALSDV